MRRRIAVLAVTATALVAGGLSNVASAATPLGPVVAAITGVVAVGTGTCNAGEIPATFSSVTIAGTFVDAASTQAYVGGVDPGAVVACIPTASPNVVVAGIPVVVTNGYLKHTGPFNTGANSGVVTSTCLNAELGDSSTNGGAFVQAGAEAVALVNLHYSVAAGSCPSNTTDVVPVATVAVMQVIPTPIPVGVNPAPTCLPICDEVAGPVVSA
jgi:hypothetical protein